VARAAAAADRAAWRPSRSCRSPPAPSLLSPPSLLQATDRAAGRGRSRGAGGGLRGGGARGDGSRPFAFFFLASELAPGAGRRGPKASSSPAAGGGGAKHWQRIRERRGSSATWRKELHLAVAAVASGSGGEEREHAALVRRPAKAGAGFVKAAASLPRAARAGLFRVEEAPPGVEPGQVVVPPPEEKGWRRGGLCP